MSEPLDVKLTRRNPDDEMLKAGVLSHIAEPWDEVRSDPIATEIADDWHHLHDAAPEDATRALQSIIGAAYLAEQILRYGDHNERNVAECLNHWIDRLRNTSEGAALLRLAEEREDG